MVKYITKANNDVLSHCQCDNEIAAGPSQLDCPWCGCGWLISCMKCRKAFTFARVVDVDRSYADIVREDFANRGETVGEDEIEHGAEWMAGAMADLTVGDTVVYLDGSYLPVSTPTSPMTAGTPSTTSTACRTLSRSSSRTPCAKRLATRPTGTNASWWTRSLKATSRKTTRTSGYLPDLLPISVITNATASMTPNTANITIMDPTSIEKMKAPVGSKPCGASPRI
jgi:hypothetical protein